jgi:NitT/TauT family transport system substrate-binding protein
LLTAAAYVAIGKKFFQEQGIEVFDTPQTGSQNSLNAVISRDLPFGFGTLNNVIVATGQGQQLKAIGLLSTGFGNTLVVSKALADASKLNEKSSISDKLLALKGKTIALTTAGGPIDIVTRQMLASVKLDPEKDVTLVYSGDAALANTALRSGRVDAGLYASPWVDEAQAGGWAVSWIDLGRGDWPPLRGMHYSVVYARADYLAGHEADAQAIVTGIARALRFMQRDRDGFRAVLRDFFPKMDQATYDKAFDNNYAIFPETPLITEEGYGVALRLVNGRTDAKPVTVAFSDAVDTTFAKKAIEAVK